MLMRIESRIENLHDIAYLRLCSHCDAQGRRRAVMLGWKVKRIYQGAGDDFLVVKNKAPPLLGRLSMVGLGGPNRALL